MTPTARILNDFIVVQTQNPGQLRAVFPVIKEAVVKGQSVVAVPYTLEAVRVLANLGISAPSPIRTKYDWPGKHRPKEHQIHTADFLTLHARSFCLNDMGTMKTLSSLWAVDYLQRTKRVKKALIVAPLSTLDPTWATEIFVNFPLKKFAVLYGSREKRLQLLKENVDIFVINHDGVEVIYDTLMEREDIDLIILDELSVYRNSKSKRWKTMNNLLNKCGFKRNAWGLTGAPTPNEPTDAFGQSKLIKPENYRSHFTAFKNETMYQLNQFKWVPRRGSEETVSRILQPSIRYELADCVDIPETIHSERRAMLSAEQEGHYKALLRTAVTEVRGSAVTAVNAAVLLGKVIQASLGVLYGVDGEVLKIDFGPRIKLVKELITECSQKVLVFVPLTGALDAVVAELSKTWSVEKIDGSTSIGKRNQIFRDFKQTKDPHVIVANAAAMSHGLTLTEASTIIWYAPTFSNDVYNQANARIARPGQKHVTHIVHIYATPEEHRIYQVLKEKGRLQDAVLDLLKEGR